MIKSHDNFSLHPLLKNIPGNKILDHRWRTRTDEKYIPQEFNGRIVFQSFGSFQQNNRNLGNRIRKYVASNIKTKNINILGITPEYINPVQNTFKIFRDSSKTLSNYQYNRQLNKAFFIRPDKYIATITGADNYNSIYDLMDEFKIKLD